MSAVTYQFPYELTDRVYIKQLEVWGVVISIYVGDIGIQFQVRYFYNGEAKNVYFFTDELSLEKP